MTQKFPHCLFGLLLVGCSSGLGCEDGEFELDGETFTDCAQCPDPDSCYFEAHTSYAYPGGVQTVTSQTVTAHCNGETATMVDGTCQ